MSRQLNDEFDMEVNKFLDVLKLQEYEEYNINGYKNMLNEMRKIVKDKFKLDELKEILTIIYKDNNLFKKLKDLSEIDKEIIEGSKSLEDGNKRKELIVSLMQLQLHTLINLFVKVQKDCPECPVTEKTTETIKQDFMPLIDKLIDKYKATADLAKTGHITYGQSSSPIQSQLNENEFMRAFNDVFYFLDTNNRGPILNTQEGGRSYKPINQTEGLAMMIILLEHAKTNTKALKRLQSDKRINTNRLDEIIAGTKEKLRKNVRYNNNDYDRAINDAKTNIFGQQSPQPRSGSPSKRRSMSQGDYPQGQEGGNYESKYLKYKSKYLLDLNEDCE